MASTVYDPEICPAAQLNRSRKVVPMMPECQELVALCHMLPPELLEIIRKKVYTAKLQERRDMGCAPVLTEIRQLEKREFLRRFLKSGWDLTRNTEDFLDWQVDNINEWALDYSFKAHHSY